MKSYAYGYDYGNSETCAVLIACDGQEICKSMPSAICHGTLDELKAVDYVLGREDYVYRDDTTELYVGKLAVTQSKMSPTSRGDNNRYWSNNSLYTLLTTAASMTDEREFSVNIVTGLPIKTYTELPDNRRRVKKALEGIHTFSLNGIERTIHVSVVRVIMEGASAIMIYGSTEKVRQGVVDIGGRTTDLYASIGQEPLLPYCDGRPLGVEMAGDIIRKRVYAQYGRELSSSEIRSILHAIVSGKKQDRIFVNGEEITDLSKIARNAIREVGIMIASFIVEKWGEGESGHAATSFAHITLIGGGAYYFKDEIVRILPGVHISPHPEYMNALAYARFADRYMKRQS